MLLNRTLLNHALTFLITLFDQSLYIYKFTTTKIAANDCQVSHLELVAFI